MRFIIVDEKWMEKWDYFVSNRCSGHFMQSFAWGKFKKLNGWEPEYFLVIQKDKIKGVSLLLSKPLPILRKRIYYLPRGPVVEPDDSETLSFLLKNIRKYVEENNGIFLRVDPYFKESEEYDLLFEKAGFKKISRKWSYWNAPKYLFWLKLGDNSEEFFKKLPGKKGKFRNKILKPYKKGVQYKKGGFSDLLNFYVLMTETAERKGIGAHGFRYYGNLYKILGDCGIAQLFLAKHNEETIAAGISWIYGKRAGLLYMASSKRHHLLRPNLALQWEMIKWAIEQGCKVYDFRGTATDDPPNPNDPGYGVYKFKKSFGPDFISTVGYYDYVVNNMLYKPFRVFEDNFLPFFADKATKLIQFL